MKGPILLQKLEIDSSTPVSKIKTIEQKPVCNHLLYTLLCLLFKKQTEIGQNRFNLSVAQNNIYKWFAVGNLNAPF